MAITQQNRSMPWDWWDRVPVSRRKLLRLGSLGLAGMGLTLPRLLASDSSPVKPNQTSLADNCILLFLNGGPSHLDMWDMKPNAPAGRLPDVRALAAACKASSSGDDRAIDESYGQ